MSKILYKHLYGKSDVSDKKIKSSFYCTECGATYPKWLGKCESCGKWSTIEELVKTNFSFGASASDKLEFSSLSDANVEAERTFSNICEFDRVCGGGIVQGSVVLIGGEPGIGKSTLLLQIAAMLSQDNECVYISGEESKQQICLRAERLSVSNSNVRLACEIDVNLILSSLTGRERFVVIDSIQTLQSNFVESIPGSIAQVKACAAEIINFAKKNNVTIFLVGHVTKDGSLAGPKVLEHMVDTVLYFEGERGNSYRILRAIKNRYGSCGEVGIFEMRGSGLASVENPSEMFINNGYTNLPGNVVFAGVEGSRPILVEVQALVAKSYLPAPRRTVVGCDLNRLLTILAVLETRCKLSFADRDVYLNVVGGLKINEPAGDLAIALSLISGRLNISLPEKTVAFGEIGLTGEIRSVAKIEERINEACKLNFHNIVSPCWHVENSNATLNMFETILECAKSIFKT